MQCNPTDPDSAYKTYLDYFVRDFEGPYAIQWPGKAWSTRHKKVSDPLIQTHLSGHKYSLATKSPWSPRFTAVDIDEPLDLEATIEAVITTLGLEKGQYQVMTSPSYERSRNVHLYIPTMYQGRPATLKLHRMILEPLIEDRLGHELYPKGRKKFRQPLGRGQYLLDEDTLMPLPMPWSEALFYLEKLEPFDLAMLPPQRKLPFEAKRWPEYDRWPHRQEAAEWLAQGLQAPHTRYWAQFLLAQYLYRLNRPIGEATEAIKRWLRAKHNGFSEKVNQGHWKRIHGEIDRQVQAVYDYYGSVHFYPDRPHNLEGYVTPADLRFIPEVFPSDPVNQKRLFALVQYCRPRAHHTDIFMGWQRWAEIADWRSYKQFQGLLEGKGLLKMMHTYRHIEGHPELSYPKRFRIDLPKATREDMIAEDGRAIQGYYAALQKVYGSLRDIRQVTRLSKQTLWNWGREHKAD